MDRFRGKVVIVTGGASGIGRGICTRFAQEKATICPIDIDNPSLLRLTNEIQGIGIETLPMHGDATNSDVVTSSIRRVLGRFGRIDILVNNVGGSVVRPILETDEAQWEPMLNLNLRSAFLWSRNVAESMISAKKGCIVNIASDLGKTGDPYSGLYIAAKHGVIGLTRALALELAPHRIRVNAVCPGIVDTTLLSNYIRQLAARDNRSVSDIRDSFVRSVPLGRLATPKDIAGVVVFLASEDANYMTGQAINVTGGMITS
jgi:NAD(P)-dependent dehydrogenase (short-subunit alcohol dehydrogenase family)